MDQLCGSDGGYILTLNQLQTDTAEAQACVDIAYFHRPFEWPNEENTPLAGLVLVLTIYPGSERNYLSTVGRIMGADVQERYIKTQCPVLICPRPEGAKYNGAIKWGMPVVSCEWLLQCARSARKVRMRPFLVGASVAPPDEPDESNASATEADEPPPGAAIVRPEAGTDSLQITAVDDQSTVALPPPPPPPAAHERTEEKRRGTVLRSALPDCATDSLQITANDAAPPAVASSSSPADSSLERPKRPWPSEYGSADAPASALKHRRLTAIARSDSPFGGSQSPQADFATNLRGECSCAKTDALSPKLVLTLSVFADNLSELSTPCRETVFKEQMHLHETETPETRRRMEAVSTPDLLRSPVPVEYRTPAREQRYRDNRNRHYLGPLPEPKPTTVRTNPTQPNQRLDLLRTLNGFHVHSPSPSCSGNSGSGRSATTTYRRRKNSTRNRSR